MNHRLCSALALNLLQLCSNGAAIAENKSVVPGSNSDSMSLSQNRPVVSAPKQTANASPLVSREPEYSASNWQTSNVDKETVASDLNRHLYIVGMPQRALCCCIGWPLNHTADSDYYFANGPYKDSLMEVQYTDDHKFVSRFRIVEKIGDKPVVGKFSDWQAINLRKHPNDFMSNESISELSNHRSPIELCYGPKFDPAEWQNRCFGRWSMVSDLVHSYRLIGMNRQEIHKLLGEPSRWHPQYDPADELSRNSECYQLTFHFCGNVSTDFLDFAYSNDKVVAFRFGTQPGVGGSLIKTKPRSAI